MNNTTLPFAINHQGAVEFSHDYGYMLQMFSTVAVFYIDLITRDSEIIYTVSTIGGIPCIGFTIDDINAETTEIAFPNFVGWEVHAAVIHKTTCAVTIVDWRPYWEAQGL